MPDYRAIARQAAEKYGVNPDIFERQIDQESGFSPTARSSAGALGIAQVMPQYHPGVNPLDPMASLDYAARLMAGYLRDYGGSYALSLGAYNSGPGNVAKYGGVPPFEETQLYIRNILGQDGGQNGGRQMAGHFDENGNWVIDPDEPTETTPIAPGGLTAIGQEPVVGAPRPMPTLGGGATAPSTPDLIDEWVRTSKEAYDAAVEAHRNATGNAKIMARDELNSANKAYREALAAKAARDKADKEPKPKQTSPWSIKEFDRQTGQGVQENRETSEIRPFTIPNWTPPPRPPTSASDRAAAGLYQAQVDKIRAEMAGTPWDQAKLGAESGLRREGFANQLEQQRMQDEAQNERNRLQQQTALSGQISNAWQAAFPSMQIPGQTHFLGFEPHGVYASLMDKFDQPYDEARFRAPITRFDPQMPWQEAARAIGGR